MERIEIKEALVRMLKDAKEEVKGFNKKTYNEKFDSLYAKHSNTLAEVERIYHFENDSLEVLDDLAKTFADYLEGEVNALPRRKREVCTFDHNLAMVTFVTPMIGKRREEFMDVFGNKCIEHWNLAFPKTKIHKSSKDDIDGGFRNGLCYITTATCDSFGKPDDCYELTLLRDYRDEYLLNTSNGKEIVERYYDIAPTIVKRIEKEEDAQVIYQGIWENYLTSCIAFIENGENEKSGALYQEMVEELSKKYFH